MARKINTQFIFIVALIIGGLMVAGGGVYYYKKKHRDPKKLLAIAVQAEKEGAYVVAAQHYQSAGMLMKDPKVLTQAGDLLYAHAYDDADNLRGAYGSWEGAISTDPTYTPALERELKYWLETLRNMPGDRNSPQLYDNMQQVARKILKNDPKNIQARFALAAAAIDSWVHRIETEQNQVDKAIKDLTDLQKDDAANPEIPYYIAQAYSAQANRAMGNSKPADAEKLNGDASRVMEEAIKADDASAKLHYRAAQIYLSLATPPADQDKLNAKVEKARAQATKASQLVKPADPDYDEIKSLAASLCKDQTESEKIYRDALKELPNNIPLRVKLAEMIGMRTDGRDEAIDLLKSLPEPAVEDRSGPSGLQLKNMELQALSSLTNLRLDKMVTVKTQSERDAMLPQIESDFRKLEAKAPDNPYILRIKAKIQIAKGQVTDAVSTLTQALPRTDERNPMRYELMFLTARCYLATNQPGSAKAYLDQIVTKIPTYDEARILLTETQLKEFNLKDAERNLDILEKPDHSPKDIRVIRMRIADLQQQKKTDQAKQYYAKLPEETRGQKLDKATIAILMQQPDDAKRLLEAVSSADPGDIEAALMLSGFYNRNKDQANALAVLDRSLKVKPGQPDLMLARAQVSGSSPAEMKQLRIKEVEKIADPLERELALLELTRDETDENIPLGHLKAAEKINPKDLRVLNAFFEYHLTHRNWDQAAPYLEKLAGANADKVGGTLLRWRVAMARAGAEQEPTPRTTWLVKALDLGTQLTHDHPEFAQSWLSLGQTCEALGRYEDAIPHFQSAMDKQPQNPDPYRGLIDCYYQLKRPEDAGKIIDKAVETVPGVALFRELKLEHELQYGNPEKVVTEREASLKDEPESAAGLMSLAKAYASVARAKAAKTATEKETNTWLEKAKSTLAHGAEAFPDELQFTISYSSICQLLKQQDQGEKFWKSMLAKPQWKDNPRAISEFTDFYLRAGKSDEATKVLRDFLATPAGKNNVEMTLKLAEVLANARKYDDAIAVVDSMPDNQQLQLRKVDLLINQGKLADAEKVINALMQKKSTPELKSALAYVYINSDRIPQAQDLLAQALNERPNMTNALFFRAMATLRTPKGKIDEAISDLVQVRDAAPGNLMARYMLVDALLKTNDTDSAIKELEGIVRFAPGQKQARTRLMDIYAAETPPRWLDAERIARDGDVQPELASDPEYLTAEGRLFSKRGDSDRAIQYMNRAMKAQPQNINLVRAYYGVLVNGKKYQDVLAEIDKLPKDQQDLWWVHAFKGTAKTKLGDKPAGLQEYVTALNSTFAAKDNTSARMIVDQMADAAGADSAIKVISQLPQGSQPQWLIVLGFLNQKKNDIPAARVVIDKALEQQDKLSPQEKALALSFAGSVYMQTPDPNLEKARDIYLQLLKLTPDDYSIYNNLACNRAVTAAQALEYGQKAYQLMHDQHVFEPLVADTYGWSLVQSGDDRNLDMGLNVLLEAWSSRHVVDIAYHLGEAYLKKNNGAEADKYLTQAQTLYNEALNNKEVLDTTLQASIVDAQTRAAKLKGKKAS